MQFLAEIRMFGGNFPPRGWFFCDGQLLAINSYSALFSLLGTTYGGDGRTTFGLPDLRGRTARHAGGSAGSGLPQMPLGQKTGHDTVQLTVSNLPQHSHAAVMNIDPNDGTKRLPNNKYLGGDAITSIYSDTVPGNTTLASNAITVGNTGGNAAFYVHNPYQAVNYIISADGVYPSRS